MGKDAHGSYNAVGRKSFWELREEEQHRRRVLTDEQFGQLAPDGVTYRRRVVFEVFAQRERLIG